MHQNRSEGYEADEAILVERAIGHDADAFGKLYDMHVDRVYRHIYYRVGNEADAEDLTQQAFLKAWQAIGRYRRASSPFVAWLMTISHNLVVDFYRTRKERAYLEAEILADDAASNPEREAEARFEQQRLRRAILQLGGDEQQVVILRFIEGFEFAEIASLLRKREGNVRVILHRALVKLRRIVEKEVEQN
ncbi:MAG: sigma-70 family RNA polymerase sigma factor [Dehalococcoidia bacterium]|nr:sigma-70 family RNA polymerase sigma factor [Dehalococcoidia bacterium]